MASSSSRVRHNLKTAVVRGEIDVQGDRCLHLRGVTDALGDQHKDPNCSGTDAIRASQPSKITCCDDIYSRGRLVAVRVLAELASSHGHDVGELATISSLTWTRHGRPSSVRTRPTADLLQHSRRKNKNAGDCDCTATRLQWAQTRQTRACGQGETN